MTEDDDSGYGGMTVGKAPTMASASKLVLMTLAVAQFLMVLDSSVMNVSIAYVANRVGTTVSGVQMAINTDALVILALTRRMADSGRQPGRSLDGIGAVLSVVGLASVVFGVLKTSEWGWVVKAGAPTILGLSPSLWLWAGCLSAPWSSCGSTTSRSAAVSRWSRPRCWRTAS